MKAETYAEFQALPKAVKDRVLEKNRDWNVEHGEWWDDVYEQFKEGVQAKGMCVDRMQFSGFWSQGDGASFDGDIDNLTLFVAGHERMAEFAELIEHATKGTMNLHIDASWKSRGGYCHARTLSHSFDSNLVEPDENDYDSPLLYQVHRRLYEDLNSLTDKFALGIEEVVEDHCDRLYKNLEEEYDCLTSDESIIESMLANDALQEAIDEAVDYLGLEEEDEPQSVYA